MSQHPQGRPQPGTPDVRRAPASIGVRQVGVAAATPMAGTPSALGGVSRWLKISGMAGIVISAAVHLVVLSVAAVIVLAQAGNSDDSGGGAPVQFAVLNESELADLAGGQLSTEAPAVPDAPASDLPEIDIQIPETIGLDAMRETLQETAGGGTGAGDISAGGDGLGGPGSGGGAGGTGAGFFGVEASGSRFAYIVDVSGSMAVGGKMDAMRSELLRSLNSLLENHRFMVVPFSTDAAPLGGRTGWVDATDNGRSWARRAVMDIEAVGGTNPSPGFFYVFSQSPKPDAIYFLTDGEFNQTVVQEVAGLNGEYDVPIHCICFGDQARAAEPMMRRIAEQSGGTYTYVSVGGGP